MSAYLNNIYREVLYINGKNSGQPQVKTRAVREKMIRKLLKYECMAMGRFKLAKIFN